MKKRIFQSALCLVLIFTLLPLSAIAAEIPELRVSRALEGFVGELTERIETTPLAAIGKLFDLLMDDGTLNIGFDYDDGYSAASGDIGLRWKENAAAIDFSIDGVLPLGALTGELLINDKRAAFATPLLGEGYYGITYANAVEQLTAIAGEDALPEYITTLFDSLTGAADAPQVELPEGYGEAYAEVIADFIGGLGIDAQAATRNGSAVTRITYKVTGEDIVGLLKSLVDVAAEDDFMRETFNNALTAAAETYTAEDILYSSDFELTDEEIAELEKALALEELFANDLIAFEPEAVNYSTAAVDYDAYIVNFYEVLEMMAEDADFDFTLTLDIDVNDRLVGAEFTYRYVDYWEDEMTAIFSLDFGKNALDVWTLSFKELNDRDNYPYTYYGNENVYAVFDWAIESGASFNNTLKVTSGSSSQYSLYEDYMFFRSEWEPKSGAFSMSVESEYVYDSGTLTGKYLPDEDGGFVLAFDNLGDADYDEVFTLEITASKGAEIAEPEYAELDEWLPTILDPDSSVMGILNGLFGSGMTEYVPLEPEPQFAEPSAAKVYVNGELTAIQGYEFMDQNYFKLRDIAAVLSGTEKQFGIDWDEKHQMIFINLGDEYEPVGGELSQITTGPRGDFLTDYIEPYYYTAMWEYGYIGASCYALEIDGANYVKLADIAESLDLSVVWDGDTYSIHIDTTKGYYDSYYDDYHSSSSDGMSDAELLELLKILGGDY